MTLARPHQSAAEADAFAWLKQAVIARTGHVYYADKDAVFAERLRRRVTATGRPSLSAYSRLLHDPRDGEGEWAALIAEITIKETYFFRFREHFQALRSVILPQVLERNRASRRVRIWSAGASTGAEAYSVAIVLRDLLGAAVDEWTVTILGSDIDEAALAMARTGLFTPWALRALSSDERAAWFDPAPGGRFLLKREYRDLVRFTPYNLLGLVEEAVPLQFTDFDIVLCRNVLIYFDPAMVQRLVTALGGTLRLDGWLLLGHAETNPAFIGSLTPVELSGATVYRRMAPVAPDAPAPQPVASTPPAEPLRSVARSRSEARSVPRTILPAVRLRPPAVDALADAPAAEDVVARVRSLSDAGQIDRAIALCRDGQRDRPTDPVLRYYEGLLHRASADPVAAAAAFRRAIYLSRDFALAHYHLGLSLLAAGDRAGGRRAIANAGRLAGGDPKSRVLAEGDGLTSGGLLDLVRLVLARGDRP